MGSYIWYSSYLKEIVHFYNFASFYKNEPKFHTGQWSRPCGDPESNHL